MSEDISYKEGFGYLKYETKKPELVAQHYYCSCLASVFLGFHGLIFVVRQVFSVQRRWKNEKHELKTWTATSLVLFYLVFLSLYWKLVIWRACLIEIVFLPWHFSPVIVFSPVIFKMKTLWLRLDRSLHFVAPTARFWAAVFNSENT